MSKIEQLAECYRQHISLPWQRTIAGAQRVIIVVYRKEDELGLRARKKMFELATLEEKHEWLELDISGWFAEWMAQDEYREAYFESPGDLELKLDSEFPEYVAAQIRKTLEQSNATAESVVAVFGTGTLFGLARVSHILKLVEPYIKGRLVVFFPGVHDKNNYRLLDARDGWNYLAVPVTLHSAGGY